MRPPLAVWIAWLTTIRLFARGGGYSSVQRAFKTAAFSWARLFPTNMTTSANQCCSSYDAFALFALAMAMCILNQVVDRIWTLTMWQWVCLSLDEFLWLMSGDLAERIDGCLKMSLSRTKHSLAWKPDAYFNTHTAQSPAR